MRCEPVRYCYLGDAPPAATFSSSGSDTQFRHIGRQYRPDPTLTRGSEHFGSMKMKARSHIQSEGGQSIPQSKSPQNYVPLKGGPWKNQRQRALKGGARIDAIKCKVWLRQHVGASRLSAFAAQCCHFVGGRENCRHLSRKSSEQSSSWHVRAKCSKYFGVSALP